MASSAGPVAVISANRAAVESVSIEAETPECAWVVNKFGGTSVASAQAMNSVKDIIMGQVRR